MVKLHEGGVYLIDGVKTVNECDVPVNEAKKGTIAYSILTAHNTSGSDKELKIKFDAMASHDITYVGIIQTARASGLKEFPLPYVLTNCHNSLCAVGGTINEDDHLFGLSAAKKYGGIYVPAHQSVIHSYMRETMTACGKMILGSDSHTRYGALGTMAIGEGGPELVKQLLNKTYDISMPEIVAVNLVGSPKNGVGPHDVAIALIGAVFASGFVKNKVLEFVGEGVKNLPIEYRNGIDVMTTETTCLSSIWITDDKTKEYYIKHNRENDYKELKPGSVAYYDSMVTVDLSKVECMMALPFHPGNAVTVNEFKADPVGILKKFGLNELLSKVDEDGNVHVEQGVIAGCAGGIYDNLVAVNDILKGKSIGSGEFTLSVYPASQPVMTRLMRTGAGADLLSAGAVVKTAFCGPCFGAGDVPANGCLSIRHSTRNFPNREGSKPGNNQQAYVALMDARSIAATALNGGVLTAATELDVQYSEPDYVYDDSAYRSRVYYGFGKADPSVELRFGPNIADWPDMPKLSDNLLMKVCSYITDEVTTTDELIPSGETSSYRSNPMKLAEFALSRKDPQYVARAKEAVSVKPQNAVLEAVKGITGTTDVQIGSVIYARKPGDGSAREQAASCQRVLGGSANIALEYATKRYRSNLINWGMLPFLSDSEPDFSVGDYILVKDVKKTVEAQKYVFDAYVIKNDGTSKELTLKMASLTDDERKIILDGCLINYYRG